MRPAKVARPLAALLLALLLLPPSARAGDEERQELWTGSILTAKFKMGFCPRADGSARGTLLLRHLGGAVDVYHMRGTLKNGELELSHPSGHFVRGVLDDGGQVRGKVRLKSGLTLSFKGERHRRARLSEDCAPLP